jgi:hypothetical protein
MKIIYQILFNIVVHFSNLYNSNPNNNHLFSHNNFLKLKKLINK